MKARTVTVFRPDPSTAMMTAVDLAQQFTDGGKIALLYVDGTVEIAASLGKRLSTIAVAGDVSESTDFPHGIFSVVSHVQIQRPKTKMMPPGYIPTMSEMVERP